jgi:hypothetical protein
MALSLPFMRHFRERIDLVHELRKLASREKVFYHRRDELGVYQVVRHAVVEIIYSHSLFDGPLKPHERDPDLVFKELADRTYPSIAQMVDIVNSALAAF